MLETVLGFGIIMITGEVLAIPIFWWVRRTFGVFIDETGEKTGPGSLPAVEIFKGILERFVVTFGLFISLPGILTVFAALKLANRLSHEADDDDDMINYFLIGNLITVLLCLAYFKLSVEFANPLGAMLTR